MRDEIYVSVDVEADGPIPGPHSMLSLGAVAVDSAGVAPISRFTMNLETLEGARPDPKTAVFWEKHPEAYQATRFNPQNPRQAMLWFIDWALKLPGKPVFVGYPASFDFMFVYWYMMKFVGHSPFGFAALDMKTLAWALLGGKFRDVNKRRMPKSWFEGAPTHDHTALQDAEGQAVLFKSMHEMLAATRPSAHETFVGETDGRELYRERR